jgi:hypothetical protein
VRGWVPQRARNSCHHDPVPFSDSLSILFVMDCMPSPEREQISSLPGERARANEPSEEFARTVTLGAHGDFGECVANFHFDGRVEGVSYPSLSPAQQDAFVAVLRAELDRLRAWCAEERWVPDACPALQIWVSDEYRISKALIPAAIGRRGRIEFPAWKIVAGEAAVAHELAHVFFPNGNRLLAEGFAIYLQARLGGNPAFPNFGRPLHDMATEVLRRMVPEFVGGDVRALEQIDLQMLDRIATPSGLRLRVGLRLYQTDDVGLAHIYPLAGSFVAFLIETLGLPRFRSLYERTQLRPIERDAGSAERWGEVYGLPLQAIEREWKAKLVAETSVT